MRSDCIQSVLISIIIPVYNVQDYIARCLDSCINQSFSDIEILVVDDCGSDDSVQIAREYAARDSRIQIISNPRNLGTFNARLEGVKHASGAYMMFVDADDYLASDACERIYAKVDACATPNISESSAPLTCKSHSEDTNSLPDIVFFGMRFEPRTFKRVSPPVITKTLRDSEVLCEVFAHTCHTSVARMCEDSHLTMSEDVLKSFYLCAMARNSVGIRDKLYVYCESSSSITRKIDTQTRDRKIADKQRVISELRGLDDAPEIASNACFKQAQTKAIDILQSTIELEYRYDTRALGGHL
ncbi:glycosyltransferase family 2 protein [uncultured Helicobacter sp.]|uniref:glycosyltransferase family 2 protein n=1 Tax=uncultured Helicobacter sp. TaxID=175537 RepID=UPI001C3AE2B2|nr:glycosyltransferase [Candidatus Helicobacter avicola]